MILQQLTFAPDLYQNKGDDYVYNYLEEEITIWSDTCIKDKKAREFINNIKSRRLRGIIKNHFEHECFLRHYTLKDFEEEFVKYLNDKSAKYYFLPGLNDKYEDILKKLLYLDK